MTNKKQIIFLISIMMVTISFSTISSSNPTKLDIKQNSDADTTILDWDPGDDHTMHWPQLPDITPAGMDLCMEGESTSIGGCLSDDFKCTKTSWLTDIHIWGNPVPDILTTIFQIKIFSNNPTGEDNLGKPGQEVWSKNFPYPTFQFKLYNQGTYDFFCPWTNYYLPNSRHKTFQYSFHIDPEDAFIQENNNIYWLEILWVHNTGECGGTFAWRTTTPALKFLSPACMRKVSGLFYLEYPPLHTEYPEEYLDLAFVINGTDINYPPETPSAPSGPATGYINKEFTYSTSTTDIDGDQIRYYFDWGDGTGDWTDYAESGQSVSLAHSWTNSGSYQVKAKAQDEHNLESGFSSYITVEIIENQPPDKPSTPSGPTEGEIEESYYFESYFNDQDDDNMEIFFDWDDGTNSGWLGPYESGSTVGKYHTWDQNGIYHIRTRARDLPDNKLSQWSDYLTITIGEVPAGNTLISDRLHNRVIEVDDTGTIVWEKIDMGYATDAERLANGNTLIAALGGVYEVDSFKNIVWQKNTINNLDVERLDNGNTLIISWDMEGYNWIIEVDKSGTIVWSKAWGKTAFYPWDVERLDNGNTIIAGTGIAYEIDSSGTEVWRYSTIYTVVDVERLYKGNTLITEYGSGKVIEVDTSNNIEWEKSGLSKPIDAERLANGNTLIVESTADRVIEVDGTGYIVWQKDTNLDAPYDAERISTGNNPPDKPTTPTGTSNGNPGVNYPYESTFTDSDGDQLYYWFDWGDGSNTGWLGPISSGTPVEEYHTYTTDGSYEIKTKSKDIPGDEVSPWSDPLSVSMPKNKQYINRPFLNFLESFFEKYPNPFPILRQLLGL